MLKVVLCDCLSATSLLILLDRADVSPLPKPGVVNAEPVEFIKAMGVEGRDVPDSAPFPSALNARTAVDPTGICFVEPCRTSC